MDESEKMYQTMPVGLHSVSSPEPLESSSSSTPQAPLSTQSSMESADVPQDSEETLAKSPSPILPPKAEENPVQSLNNYDDDTDTDSYSKSFEESVESDKRMARSQSMPPDGYIDGDIWGDEDADDDDSEINDSTSTFDRSNSVPESTSNSSGLGDSCKFL